MGSLGSHDGAPGSIVRAGTKLKVNGRDISVVGDLYYCTHGDHEGHYELTNDGASEKLKIGGQRVACVGTKAACGATITEGEDKFKV